VAGWMDSLALRLATFNLGNSRAVADEMLSVAGCPQNKCGAIVNGVDVHKFRPSLPSDLRQQLDWNHGETILGMIGNFREVKRHNDFVSAAAILSAAHPQVRFLMAGADAGTKTVVQKQVERLGLVERVRIMDATPEPENIFAAIDIYVCASSAEGFSNAVLEAMACGKPVVATRAGGNPEAVLNGETGFLVPVGSPAAIALAADRLITNLSERTSMGIHGRQRAVEQFPLQAMVAAHQELYCRLYRQVHRIA
jgi:glycosyltransferase involved in cell wall biosynthesis